MALVELAADFAIKVLAPGGAFVTKVFQGGTEHELLALLKQNFNTTLHAKPPALALRQRRDVSGGAGVQGIGAAARAFPIWN